MRAANKCFIQGVKLSKQFDQDPIKFSTYPKSEDDRAKCEEENISGRC